MQWWDTQWGSPLPLMVTREALPLETNAIHIQSQSIQMYRVCNPAQACPPYPADVDYIRFLLVSPTLNPEPHPLSADVEHHGLASDQVTANDAPAVHRDVEPTHRARQHAAHLRGTTHLIHVHEDAARFSPLHLPTASARSPPPHLVKADASRHDQPGQLHHVHAHTLAAFPTHATHVVGTEGEVEDINDQGEMMMWRRLLAAWPLSSFPHLAPDARSSAMAAPKPASIPISLIARLCSMMSAPQAPVSSMSNTVRRVPPASGKPTSRWGRLAIWGEEEAGVGTEQVPIMGGRGFQGRGSSHHLDGKPSPLSGIPSREGVRIGQLHCEEGSMRQHGPRGLPQVRGGGRPGGDQAGGGGLWGTSRFSQ